VLIGLLMAGVAIQPANAVDNVRREVRHFFECLGLMIGNPPGHADNCLPNRVPSPNGSIQSTTGGVSAVPVVAPTPPVVLPPPPPPPAPPACVCGACYAL
jgi:hypothetical protein